MTRSIFVSRFLILLLASSCFAGCSLARSVSKSSKSVSGSASTSCDWIWSAGGEEEEAAAAPAEAEAAYQRDVSTYTVAFVDSSRGRDDFLRGLTRVASEHRVTSWESAPGTWCAIGRGLKRSGIDVVAADTFTTIHFKDVDGAASRIREAYSADS